MAYIPDESIYDSSNLSDAAFKIWCLLCARRNHQSERTFCNALTIVRLLGVSKATVYRGIKELEFNNWISREGSVYRLEKGDFTPMLKRTNGSLKSETKSLTFETPKSQNRDSVLINHEFKTSITPDVREASQKLIDEEHEKNATNGPCPWCLGEGVVRMKSGDLRTCRCQPSLREALES